MRRLSALQGAALAYGVAATVVVLAVLVLGDRWAVTYTAALFSSWWLLPAPVLLVAGIARRSWPVVTAVVVPAVLWAWLQGPLLVNRVGGEDGPADLRVATYNVTAGAPLDGLATLVREQDPDVLLLQEVVDRRRPEVEALPGYPHRSFGRLAANGEDGDRDVVLSRYPIVDVRPVTGLPEGARPVDVVTLDVDGRELAVLSVHLASPCLGCGGGRREANPAGGTGAAARVRVAEAERLATVVAGLVAEGRPVVLGGDLNSSTLNEPLRVLTGAGLVDVHRAVGTRPQFTRGPGPGVARVDVVLVAGLRPVADAEGARGASTHSPVVADLAWPGT
ncbi:endonuclease/exonuclease/phosphatase family protein [Modestobacter sp. SYSU DS0657]